MATVTKRKDSYKITVSCGYDLEGKQIRKHITWEPDPGMTEKQEEKELNRQVVLFEEKCRNGQILDGSIRFADFADKWFSDYAAKHLRAKTVARYKSLMERINPAIGHIRLDKLQPHQLISFYDNLQETGIRNDLKMCCKIDMAELLKTRNLTREQVAAAAHLSKNTVTSIVNNKSVSMTSAKKVSDMLGMKTDDLFDCPNKDDTLSDKTILYYHRLISSILSTAVQWQVILSNPCDRVKPPRVSEKEAKYLDENSAARLLELLEEESTRNRTIIYLLLYTGLRRGELCGLEWSDIDFENNVITVRRSSLYLPEKGVFEDNTKTISSQRSIKTPASAMSMLRTYKAWQNEERLKLGDKWHSSNRLFTTWDGHPIHPDSITGWFHRFVQKNDLPSVSIHSLRHTNATLQIAGGVDIRTVAGRLGHAKASTTTNIYSHFIKSANEAAAEVLEDILSPTKRKNKTAQ